MGDASVVMSVRWYDQLWPMGGVLTASLLIAWATEVASFFLSRGLAFALLAFLQVLPEFAVEAVITTSAGADASNLQYVTANFTGANRLIVGLFVPMTFYIAAWRARKKGQRLAFVQLPDTSSLEVVFLLVPTLYTIVIAFKGNLTPVDSVLLIVMYLAYLAAVYRLPPEEEEHADLPLVPRTIRRWPALRQKLAVLLLFAVGGVLLFSSVDPFYNNTKEVGLAIGLSAYFVLQWLAPFLSEFPEFITILYWSRTGRSQLGVTNAVSSNINQVTLLIGMLPFAFAYGSVAAGHGSRWEIPFDDSQQVEILLTSAQLLFATFALLDLKLDRWQAHTLLGLWVLQLFDPLLHPFMAGFPTPFHTGYVLREYLAFLYLLLTAFTFVLHRGRFVAFPKFRETWRTYVRPVPAPVKAEP